MIVYCGCHRNGGFSFIELLVAMLVLSIGLLGLASLQMAGLQSNYSANMRSQATLFSYEIVDAMRANRQAALSGDYNKGFGDYEDASPGNGGSAAQRDLNNWAFNLREQLPRGAARIQTASDGSVMIVVRWLDDRSGGLLGEDEPSANGSGEQEFRYVTEI